MSMKKEAWWILAVVVALIIVLLVGINIQEGPMLSAPPYKLAQDINCELVQCEGEFGAPQVCIDECSDDCNNDSYCTLTCSCISDISACEAARECCPGSILCPKDSR
jgi:hypothetical protein